MNILYHLTVENLKKNRLRTLVTLIGISLSVALFTAVTTSVASLQSYMVRVVVADEGSWHGSAAGLDEKRAAALKTSEGVSGSAFLRQLGYAPLKASANEFKPYLFVGAMEAGFTELLPVHLTEGRMPQNGRELLVPEHLFANGGLELKLGQTLDLELGERLLEGNRADQSMAFLGETRESLQPGAAQSYQVVGFYERPSFEPYSAPGYTLLTLDDGTGPAWFDGWFQMDRMRDVYAFSQANFPDLRTGVNSSLLRFTGNSDENTLNAVLFGMVAILSGLILFGSVALIYNAFAISVSERTRQFGLLRSLGATRRQIRQNILYEGLILGLIGIPLGILVGLAGIGLTFHFSRDVFSRLGSFAHGVRLMLEPSPQAILAAALLGIVAVLISAWIPSRRAAKVSPMDAIRQSQDILVPTAKVKSQGGLSRFFGFEGSLAAKNFRRNRKRYRATVFSLFLSVVLFISASSFTAYLAASMGSVFLDSSYDLRYVRNSEDALSVEATHRFLVETEGVAAVSFEENLPYQTVILPEGIVAPDFSTYIADSGAYVGIPGLETEGDMLNMQLIFLDDGSFRGLLADNDLIESEYFSALRPKALLYDQVSLFDSKEKRYYPFRLLGKDNFSAEYVWVKPDYGPNYYFGGTMENGAYVYYQDDPQASQPKTIQVSPQEVESRRVLELGARIREMPMMNRNATSPELKVIYPVSLKEAVLGAAGEEAATSFYMIAPEHQAVYERLSKTLRGAAMASAQLVNEAASRETERAIIAIVSIFSYGFIILISLIAAANVFSTIHTNIGLRRREFAMLRSVGMEKQGFRRMMTYESLLYGSRSLIFGLPAALVVTWLIHRSMRQGLEITFFVPWISVFTAVFSVFIVVSASTVYAMKTLRKESTVEALKNENI